MQNRAVSQQTRVLCNKSPCAGPRTLSDTHGEFAYSSTDALAIAPRDLPSMCGPVEPKSSELGLFGPCWHEKNHRQAQEVTRRLTPRGEWGWMFIDNSEGGRLPSPRPPSFRGVRRPGRWRVRRRRFAREPLDGQKPPRRFRFSGNGAQRNP